MFEHCTIRMYTCGSHRERRGEFDERFYGRQRAAHLGDLYTEWMAAEARAEAYNYERDNLNDAAAAAYSLLSETEKRYREEKMNIMDAGILKYMTGDMVKDKRSMAFIADVRMEEVAQGKMKPVLYLKEWRLGIVLNAGNTRQLAAAYGMETDAWRNQPVIIYAERGTWFGKDGWAVRLAIPAAVPTPAPAMPAYEEIMSEGMAI